MIGRMLRRFFYAITNRRYHAAVKSGVHTEHFAHRLRALMRETDDGVMHALQMPDSTFNERLERSVKLAQLLFKNRKPDRWN